MVTLDISQEVSAPGETPVGNPNPNVATRSAKTAVVVASGDSIVLGGLIRETGSRSTTGLPLLSKIPILGAFRHADASPQRTELVLMITPRIVSDTAQAREVTDELRRKLPSLEASCSDATATRRRFRPAAPPAQNAVGRFER
jgi:general secretion pathway protein D